MSVVNDGVQGCLGDMTGGVGSWGDTVVVMGRNFTSTHAPLPVTPQHSERREHVLVTLALTQLCCPVGVGLQHHHGQSLTL